MTKADKKRLDIIHRLPCVACVQEGNEQPLPTEAHHIVDNGYRRLSGGHSSTLSLCGWHHRAQIRNAKWTAAEMTELFGPSLALNKRAFVARYGSERELLERVNAIIG